MTPLEEEQREKIFDLNQAMIQLRGQITYLQEELADVETKSEREIADLKMQIVMLEEELGR